MITVFHTSSKSNEKLIEFRDNWLIENPNILVYPEFQNYDAPYSDLLRNMENQDVVIFITSPLTQRLEASLTHKLGSIKHILKNIDFRYINHVVLIRDIEYKHANHFNKRIAKLRLINFFENNFDVFKELADFSYQLSYRTGYDMEFNSTNVFSGTRHRKFVFCRQLLSYLIYQHRNKNPLTLKQIANLFGKDHSTIIHSHQVIEAFINIYAKERQNDLINELKIKLGEEICKLN